MLVSLESDGCGGTQSRTDFDIASLVDGDTGVGGAQINANGAVIDLFGHDVM
jgi:hypothetical protein